MGARRAGREVSLDLRMSRGARFATVPRLTVSTLSQTASRATKLEPGEAGESKGVGLVLDELGDGVGQVGGGELLPEVVHVRGLEVIEVDRDVPRQLRELKGQ